MKIKFGTDGWRAIIAEEYTVDNVARVTMGAAQWLNNNFENPSDIFAKLFAAIPQDIAMNKKIYPVRGFI